MSPSRSIIRLALVCLLVPAACAAGPDDDAPRPDAPREPPAAKALLVFPIAGDEPDLADKVERMLRMKARRLGAVIYDSQSVREALAAEPAGPDTPPARLAAIARDRFGADLAVAGRVHGRGPYRLRLVAVRTDTGTDAPVVFDRTLSCPTHQAIPTAVADAVRDILGAAAADPLASLHDDPDARRRWRDGPNLVPNPGFDDADDSRDGPAAWQPLEPQTAWAPDPDGPGKVLRFDMTRATAVSYGLDFYSDWIPIEAGAAYRFACRVKSLGPTVKIFLKGYHEFPPAGGYPAQRRETYRRQVHPSGDPGEWQSVVADFVPGATRPEHAPTLLKVDLYAYHVPGAVFWDDVVLKKLRDAPTASAAAPGSGPSP